MLFKWFHSDKSDRLLHILDSISTTIIAKSHFSNIQTHIDYLKDGCEDLVKNIDEYGNKEHSMLVIKKLKRLIDLLNDLNLNIVSKNIDFSLIEQIKAEISKIKKSRIIVQLREDKVIFDAKFSFLGKHIDGEDENSIYQKFMNIYYHKVGAIATDYILHKDINEKLTTYLTEMNLLYKEAIETEDLKKLTRILKRAFELLRDIRKIKIPAHSSTEDFFLDKYADFLKGKKIINYTTYYDNNTYIRSNYQFNKDKFIINFSLINQLGYGPGESTGKGSINLLRWFRTMKKIATEIKAKSVYIDAAVQNSDLAKSLEKFKFVECGRDTHEEYTVILMKKDCSLKEFVSLI